MEWHEHAHRIHSSWRTERTYRHDWSLADHSASEISTATQMKIMENNKFGSNWSGQVKLDHIEGSPAGISKCVNKNIGMKHVYEGQEVDGWCGEKLGLGCREKLGLIQGEVSTRMQGKVRTDAGRS